MHIILPHIFNIYHRMRRVISNNFQIQLQMSSDSLKRGKQNTILRLHHNIDPVFFFFCRRLHRCELLLACRLFIPASALHARTCTFWTCSCLNNDRGSFRVRNFEKPSISGREANFFMFVCELYLCGRCCYTEILHTHVTGVSTELVYNFSYTIVEQKKKTPYYCDLLQYVLKNTIL